MNITMFFKSLLKYFYGEIGMKFDIQILYEGKKEMGLYPRQG
jgi:hypothetical protein